MVLLVVVINKVSNNMWFIKKPHVNDLHPTMKPVELVERAVRNSSKTRDTILDPFGGSGTRSFTSGSIVYGWKEVVAVTAGPCRERLSRREAMMVKLPTDKSASESVDDDTSVSTNRSYCAVAGPCPPGRGSPCADCRYPRF